MDCEFCNSDLPLGAESPRRGHILPLAGGVAKCNVAMDLTKEHKEYYVLLMFLEIRPCRSVPSLKKLQFWRL
jgi:hypothetical protein